jgi:hypothetical protein
MNTNDGPTISSRAKLQTAIDAAIDDALKNLGISTRDPETLNRLLRCLVRRAVRELLTASVAAKPGALVQAFMSIAVDTIQSMMKKGEIKSPAPVAPPVTGSAVN